MTGGIVKRQDLPVPLNASGNGSGQIINNNSAVMWKVEQVSVVTSPRTSGATCELTPPTGIIDTSYFAGTGDVAGGDPPIYLTHGDYITCTFANGPANGQGIVTYYYEEI